MKTIVSIQRALTLPFKGGQVVYLENLAELNGFLMQQACEAILLNDFDPPQERFHKLEAELPFFRIILIEEFSLIDAVLEDEAKQEKYSIERRLTSLRQLTNKELVQELVNMFINKLSFYSTEFSRVIEAKNSEELSFYSHNLKSSSANLGALKLTQVCQYIETISDKKDFLRLKIYVNVILNEYSKVILYLQNFANSHL